MAREMKQVYAMVDGADTPRLVIRPKQKKGEGYPANLVELPGVVLDIDGVNFQEGDAWHVAQKIHDLCQEGHASLSSVNLRNSYMEHLAHAYMVLCDCAKLFGDDWTISKETFETMIRGSIDEIVTAGKCFGFNLQNYRSEDK